MRGVSVDCLEAQFWLVGAERLAAGVPDVGRDDVKEAASVRAELFLAL